MRGSKIYYKQLEFISGFMLLLGLFALWAPANAFGRQCSGYLDSVVIVDGYSSGGGLPEYFRRRDPHLHLIHVHSAGPDYPADFKSSFVPSAYDEIIYHNGSVDDTLRRLEGRTRVAAVVAGADNGTILTDQLSQAMGVLTNGTALSLARANKFVMGETVALSGLRAVKQKRCRSLDEVLEWTRDYEQWPVVLKPLQSSGTDGVSICHSILEVIAAFHRIFGKTNQMLGVNDWVLVQEYLHGIEFSVNTMSSHGRHRVTDIWQYQRKEVKGAATIYEHDRLLRVSGIIQDQLKAYVLNLLDVLGVLHGPGHFEIKMTPHGPTLIEMGARLCGGGLPGLAARVTNNDPLDLMVTAYLEPEKFPVNEPEYSLRSDAAMVFLQAPEQGLFLNAQKLAELRRLPGVGRLRLNFPVNAQLPRTIDSETVIGTLEVTHEDPAVVDETLRLIHNWEADGLYQASP